MKKLLLTTIGALALAISFSSCAKDKGASEPAGNEFERINIKISGVTRVPSTRLVEAPAVQGQLVLQNGQIFIINSLGSIVQSVPLDVAAATTSPGQTITTPVSSDSRVYVLGNIPSSVNVAQFTTFEQLRSYAVLISHSEQINYKTALMGNDTGSPSSVIEMDSATNTATANVTIAPLYSRIELAEVVGSSNVVSFDVTGVFVDEYYGSFTLTGAAAGAIYHQSTRTDFTGNIGDAGTWSSTGGLGTAVATPGGTNVWAYHVASSGLPRLIIRLNHIMIDNDGDGGDAPVMIDLNGDGNGIRYITVTGYQGDNVPANFERGKYYQIASIVLDASDEDGNIGQEPNPTDVTVTAQLQVRDWTPVVLLPETR